MKECKQIICANWRVANKNFIAKGLTMNIVVTQEHLKTSQMTILKYSFLNKERDIVQCAAIDQLLCVALTIIMTLPIRYYFNLHIFANNLSHIFTL